MDLHSVFRPCYANLPAREDLQDHLGPGHPEDKPREELWRVGEVFEVGLGQAVVEILKANPMAEIPSAGHVLDAEIGKTSLLVAELSDRLRAPLGRQMAVSLRLGARAHNLAIGENRGSGFQLSVGHEDRPEFSGVVLRVLATHSDVK